MSIDPRILIRVLDTLDNRIRSWTSSVSSTAMASISCVQQLTGAVTDLCAVINAFEVDAQAGLSTAQTAVARSDLALAEAQWSRDRSGGIHQLGLRVLAHADAARSAWTQKLADARQDLAAAQAEEMRARAEEADARKEEAEAQAEKSSAEFEELQAKSAEVQARTAYDAAEIIVRNAASAVNAAHIAL